MNTSTTCDEGTRRSNAERYVFGQMSPRDAQDFEDHFVGCEACQREVRFVSAVGASVRQPVGAVAIAQPGRRRAMYWGGAITALAIAASVLLIVVPRLPDRAITALGIVSQAPVYLGVAVRDAGSARDSLFDRGMQAYSEHRYADAAKDLSAVATGGGDAPAARFFLATSYLLENRSADAAAEYARVLAAGESGYRAEARYYRAKALLRLGRAADAEAELRALTPADGVTFEMGASLADSVARLRK